MENQALATICTWIIFDDEDDDEEKNSKNRSCWTKNWISKRPEEGFYAKLLIEE